MKNLFSSYLLYALPQQYYHVREAVGDGPWAGTDPANSTNLLVRSASTAESFVALSATRLRSIAIRSDTLSLSV